MGPFVGGGEVVGGHWRRFGGRRMVSMVVEAIDCVAEVVGDNRDEIGGRGGPFEMIRRSWEAEIACSVVTEAIEHVFEVIRVNRT